jgi:hypothetical protein
MNNISIENENKSLHEVTIIDMEKVLKNSTSLLEKFKKASYEECFWEYLEEHRSTFEAIERKCLEENTFLDKVAEHLALWAKQELEKCKKNREKEKRLMDFNLTIIAYLNPAIIKFKGEWQDTLAEKILKAWKEQFPKTNLSISNFEQIQDGFKNKLCYITTAVCETFNKPDDCYELQLLRNYRDNYLASIPDGLEIVEEYYNIAPTIVNRIRKSDQNKEIFKNIWVEYLKPCITLIEKGLNEECKVIYIRMVRTLQEIYMPYYA